MGKGKIKMQMLDLESTNNKNIAKSRKYILLYPSIINTPNNIIDTFSPIIYLIKSFIYFKMMG